MNTDKKEIIDRTEINLERMIICENAYIIKSVLVMKVVMNYRL